MKELFQQHDSAALSVLNKLLLADRHLVQRDKRFIRVKNLGFLKMIMPENLRMKDLMRALKRNKFENIRLKRKFVILAPSQALERALLFLVDEMENRHEKLNEVINTIKIRIEEAQFTHEALKRLQVKIQD